MVAVPRVKPELRLLSVQSMFSSCLCGVSSVLSGFLPPSKNTLYGGLAILNCSFVLKTVLIGGSWCGLKKGRFIFIYWDNFDV